MIYYCLMTHTRKWRSRKKEKKMKDENDHLLKKGTAFFAVTGIFVGK